MTHLYFSSPIVGRKIEVVSVELLFLTGVPKFKIGHVPLTTPV